VSHVPKVQPGFLVSFFLFLVVLASSIGQLPAVMDALKDSLAAAANVSSLLDTAHHPQQSSVSSDDPSPPSSISFIAFADASIAAIHVPPPSPSSAPPLHPLVPAVAPLSHVNVGVQPGR